MSSKAKFNIGILLFLMIAFFGIYQYRQIVDKHAMYGEVVELNGGFGYKIMRGKRVLIVQEYIPGIAGKQPFATKEQAIAVAHLVVSKLNTGKSPIVLPSELEKFKILIH
ncbi:protein of unknown function [Maribacter sedimenticola]|uniref:DUF4907 domain-containing protein n=1 Tax=Maribacter sedimenticola TaxID=228956 RepID=A0ABY1SES0_9FLAO|nr:DUF4907 domain-containing protein [Maribacter sedimenticola]SNR38850.1 protein of unknown function [Maribacter sedimenticola]